MRTFSTKFFFFFYRAEWDQAYKQIYSDDTVAQVKGFERLLVWKARCAFVTVTDTSSFSCLCDEECINNLKTFAMIPYLL